MSCFGSAAINKKGLDTGISPDFPPVQKLATRQCAPQLGIDTKSLSSACRLSNMFAFKRSAPSFESNQFAWASLGQESVGTLLSRRYPAARDLCGNGLMHYLAKIGGLYE